MRKIFFVLFLLFTLFAGSSVYAATETVRIYPSDTATIRVYDNVAITEWELARNYDGDQFRGPGLNWPVIAIKSHMGPTGWRIYRHLINFDTSVIPDSAFVQKVVFGAHRTPGQGDNNSSDTEVVITRHLKEVSEGYSIEDGIITKFGEELSKSFLEENQYTEFVFDETDSSYVNLSGHTILGAITNFDYSGENPGPGSHEAAFYGLGSGTSTDPYLEITYTTEDPEPEVDALVLKYAPKLAFFKGAIKGDDVEEWYLPMSVKAFVNGSALWDGDSKAQLFNADDLDWEQFAEVIEDTADTSDHYLAFSDPDTEGSFDLDAAHTKYDALTDPDAVYYHKVNDGDFTVLQYWYFYAMNNWKEYGGVNDHEGDWESVFVFLDKDTLDPEYVAYSAHLNDGDPGFLNPKQYDSVRREWGSDEVEKDGDTITSYVALGSHANYPMAGKLRVFPSKFDFTSDTGEQLDTSEVLGGNEINEDDPFWMQYAGLWGANIGFQIGGSGPTGPQYIDVTGQVRFSEPVAWAGIDQIEKYEANGGETEAGFENPGVFMRFKEGLSPATWIKVDPHVENIFFGSLPEGVTLLPKFWDITSNLENGTFEAEVAFEYESELVEALGGDERTLRVFYYDPDLDVWQPQPSWVDRVAKTVSFKTDHFSRYALGYTEPEVYVGDLFDQIVALIEGSELSMPHKRNLIAKAERLRGIVNETDRRSLTAKEQLLTVFLGIADNKQYAEGFTEDELNTLSELVGEVQVMLEMEE